MAKEMVDKMLQELERIKDVLTNARLAGKIPEIERDLILSKLRVIYEFMLIYQPEPDSEKKNLRSKPKNKIDTEEEVKTLIETIDTPKVIEESVSSPPPIIEAKDESTDKSKKSGKVEILAEKLKAPGTFRNEVLARYANTFDLVKKYQHAPLSNIFEAIGVNDGFLFIKELFNNNADLYRSTIEKLNASEDFNDAVEYIDKQFKWDFDSPVVQKFLELVHRRHPSSNS